MVVNPLHCTWMKRNFHFMMFRETFEVIIIGFYYYLCDIVYSDLTDL